MVAMAAILDFQPAGLQLFFICMSTCCYIVSFNLIYLVVCEKMSKTDFQDGSCGRHLGLLIDTNLAHFDPEVVLLLQRSFSSNQPKVWEEMSKSDFQDGGCGGHLGFLIGPAILAVLCLLGASMLLIKFQLNWIIVFRGDVQNMNSQHYSHINVWGPYKCMGKQI